MIALIPESAEIGELKGKHQIVLKVVLAINLLELFLFSIKVL
jgi:hypothetical protein